MENIPVISVIIPCYNSGAFIREAIESVEIHPDKSIYEIVIINDGTTDTYTLKILNELKKEGYTIIHQPNQGPASARNTGIRLAKGKYILLLDSDNRIRPAYIDKGIEIMNANEEVGVVYGNAHFFGDKEGISFKPRAFDMMSMLIQNYIDNCAVIRKLVWDELGGFDEDRVLIGHEDWDFWIRVGASRWKFFYIDEILFDYRLRKDSLINQAAQHEKASIMQAYIFKKYSTLYFDYYRKLYENNIFYLNDQKAPFRSFLKYFKNKFFSN